MLKIAKNPRVACATMVYNEKYWFPIWLKYYKNFGDIFVLDNDTTDNTFENVGGINRILVKSEFAFDHKFMIEKRNELIKSLFDKKYDAVIFTDADEFVVPFNFSLREIIVKMLFKKVNYVYCTGYDVLQHEGDTPLNFNEPILAQRKLINKNFHFSKPAIFTRYTEWGSTHCLTKHIKMGNKKIDETMANKQIALLHMHWADLSITLKRHEERLVSKKFNPADIQSRTGYHNYNIEFGKTIYNWGVTQQSDKIPKEWEVSLPL